MDLYLSIPYIRYSCSSVLAALYAPISRCINNLRSIYSSIYSEQLTNATKGSLVRLPIFLVVRDSCPRGG